MPFTALGLIPELTRALGERGYTEPTPIQQRVIPEILAGRDILAGAQTGTGKTAAFTLPILQLLHAGSASRDPRALILVPTRELAAQVAESVKNYGKHLRLRTLVVFGGVSINPQIDALRRGADILVATPGRLLDLAQQTSVNLSSVRMFVLDEADRMLDMGFIADIKRVIKLLPPRRQNLMFSATYSEDIRRLAQSLLRDPAEIEVARRNAAVDSVDQRVYKVAKDQKRALLSHLISEGGWNQVLVFTRTKHGANRLTKQLHQDGIEAAAIHGNKSQNARTQALAAFKQAKIQALVATEVASRGLDIKELPHVVNYELPNVPEDYVHRIGRTGRAGASGHAISLVSPDETGLLKDIERLLRKPIPEGAVPKFKPAPPPVPDRERRNETHRAPAHARTSESARGDSHSQGQPSRHRHSKAGVIRTQGQGTQGQGRQAQSRQAQGRQTQGQARPSSGARPGQRPAAQPHARPQQARRRRRR